MYHVSPWYVALITRSIAAAAAAAAGKAAADAAGGGDGCDVM